MLRHQGLTLECIHREFESACITYPYGLEQLNTHTRDQLVTKKWIHEAMKQLSDQGKAQRSIREIMYDAGFNSKSSFSTAFRKYTGKTPS
ncbi:MAG: helix-turn-helix domain-containing protein, partial [Cyclobacteriaceae bacterium]